MVYDIFCFSGEYDMLEIRFNLLWDYVDQFILIEAPITFSGKPKPLYWDERDQERFKKFDGKVFNIVVQNFYKDEETMKLLDESPLVPDKKMEHYKRAFYQKEMGRYALKTLGANDEDVVYYGDCDEVWIPKHYHIDDNSYKLRQIAYSYYLNNRSPEDWRGTIVTKYKNVKNSSLNALRADQSRIINDGGWHWTNLGGHEAVIKKLESYDHQEANNEWVKNGLAERMAQNIDFLGRNYVFWIDESDLPKWVIDNKERFKHLWKS